MGRILILVVLILVIAYVAVAMLVINKRHATRRAVAARCDQQNAWFLAGDPRGIYGGKPDPPPIPPIFTPGFHLPWVEPIAGRRNPMTGQQETVVRVSTPPERSWIEFEDWRGRTVPPSG